MSNHILITGGRGFIGTNLVRTLRDLMSDKWRISTLDIKSVTDSEEQEGHHFGNYTDNWMVYNLFNEYRSRKDPITHVIHLGGQVGVPSSYELPYRDADINILGTLRLLDICTTFGVERFLLASSTAVIGDGIVNGGTINEETIASPTSPYGISKLASEYYLRFFCTTTPLLGMSLRFSNVYGPYSDDKTSVIHRFIREAFNSGEITVDGGSQSRDFIFVSDLCYTIHKCLTYNFTDSTYQLFNLASGYSVSITQLAELIVEIFRTKYNKKIKINFGKPRIGEVGRIIVSPQKIQDMLNLKAYYSIKTGILETLNYYAEKYHI